MRVLVFDTETTDKFDFKAPASASHQPDVVQIAAILYHFGLRTTIVNLFVVAEKEISAEASATHNIEKNLLRDVGMPRKVALAIFNNLLKISDLIVGHNVDFDINIMKTGYYREGLSQDLLLSKPKFCTMRKSTDVLKLPGKYGNKWPSLSEAYKNLVDPAGFTGAHDALVDVKACAEVFFKLQEKNIAPKTIR